MNTSKKGESDNLLLVNWEALETSVFHRQHVLLAVILLCVLIVYVFRLWQLQVLEGPKYRYQSENNRVRLEDIVAPRGIIFDRNGVPLVENRPAYQLVLIREDVRDMDGTIQKLAELCGKTPEEFLAVIEAHKSEPKFVPLKLVTDLDRDSLARVEAQRLRLPGVMIQLEPKREYRWNGVAAHLIGYLSEIAENEIKSEAYQGYLPGEFVGKVGVEKAFENSLHGKRGGRQVEVDAIGRRIRLIDELLPVPGRNLWLTIDIELQKVAEAALAEQTGAIVAVDPKSGAVLAAASSPSFDQEQFIRGLTKEEWNGLSRNPDHPLLNRGIGAAYPPGSTFKAVVALAVLQEGLLKPENGLFCPGYLYFGNRRYRCWRDHGHGTVNLHQALVQSCDVYFYQCGLKLGVDKIAHYASALGLGEKTGLGLHAEHPGLVPTSWWKKQAIGVPWQKGETLSVAIGQGFNLATPLQMTMAYATIANGGNLWQPYVVRRIEGNSLEESSEVTGKLRRKIPVDPKYIEIVQKGLLGVVEEERGTAHRMRIDNVPMAGKTGTAQVVRLPDGANRKANARALKAHEMDHAWFVCYAPANDPQIAVGVMLEHGGHGASAAAPLARKVVAAYMGVPPESSGQ